MSNNNVSIPSKLKVFQCGIKWHSYFGFYKNGWRNNNTFLFVFLILINMNMYFDYIFLYLHLICYFYFIVLALNLVRSFKIEIPAVSNVFPIKSQIKWYWLFFFFVIEYVVVVNNISSAVPLAFEVFDMNRMYLKPYLKKKIVNTYQLKTNSSYTQNNIPIIYLININIKE